MQPVEQHGRVRVYIDEALPHLRMRIAEEPSNPICVRVFLSEETWATLKSDTKALLGFYRSVREYDFPVGLHHLFGPDYQRAVRRVRGELPSQAWYAGLAD